MKSISAFLSLFAIASLNSVAQASPLNTRFGRRDIPYKLPEGYTVARTIAPDPVADYLGSAQIYAVAVKALLALAYEESATFSDPHPLDFSWHQAEH